MKREALRGHALVLISTLAGIVGMGIVFGGAMRGDFHTIMQGSPFLLLGLWWAGRELGRSMIVSRTRTSLAQQNGRHRKAGRRP
jgi:Na+/proline symporter